MQTIKICVFAKFVCKYAVIYIYTICYLANYNSIHILQFLRLLLLQFRRTVKPYFSKERHLSCGDAFCIIPRPKGRGYVFCLLMIHSPAIYDRVRD